MLLELKRGGLKLTPQRLAIVREIADDTSHPTAQELFDRLQRSFPTMSFATVYNTLDSLAQLGLIGSIRLGTAVRFDPNIADHHHAVCDACGSVIDVDSTPLDPAERLSLSRKSSFLVRSEERVYRGLCGSCANHTSRASRSTRA
jgi:Fe2+ or Zn2+ uptake regulation protein